MDLTQQDSIIGGPTSGGGEIVEVAVSGCTFGPHTRDFGLQYVMSVPDGRAPGKGEFIGRFYVGRSGNNSRPRAVLKVELPVGFSTKPVIQQVMSLETAARRAGIDLSYHERPKVLRPEDVRCNVYFTESQRLERALFFLDGGASSRNSRPADSTWF